ncbi:hypothetical protein CCMA1212_003249 [Trichoderma ghanense]|uniref:Uncharacterized protein n=1 Tax=Trichoderma ghanense TaxID=65468 RepID=A0ABY2HB29_9HYPO
MSRRTKLAYLTSKGLQLGRQHLQLDRLADEDGLGKATHQARHDKPLPLTLSRLLLSQLQSVPQHLQLDLLAEEDGPGRAIHWLLHNPPPVRSGYPRMT